MSITSLFLLAVVAVYFRFTYIQTLVLLVGYAGFATLEQWYRRRRRAKVIDEELFEWKVDKEESEYESRGNLSRRRLTAEDQLVAVRIVQILERLL